MPVHHLTACFLLIPLALYPTGSGAVNFSQCLVDVINCANDQTGQACVSSLNISNTTASSLLRTSRSNTITTIDTATALSYHGCIQYCGAGQEPFTWIGFSQTYSQWLLPYLALVSQLPFGSLHKMDNLLSMIMTLGSPTLAAYSLYMTLLNARWLNHQLFSGIDFPSLAVRRSVVRVLSGLQQVPLRVHPGNSGRFESLIVHPDNDAWWSTFAEELDYSHTWSISSATSITWVVIAYLLTVTDSLSNVVDSFNSNGQGTSSVWLWLLPVVVGWLVISPKCDFSRVHEAYHKANRQAFVADRHDPTALPTQVTCKFGLTISPSPYWKLANRNVTSQDECRIPPVFNYARTLSWSRTVYVTSLFYRAAWRKSSRRVGVDGNTIPGSMRSDVPRKSRLGNRAQIFQYCRPERHEYPGVGVLWPRGVLFNMFVASLMALQLQWGTTMAAVLATWFIPTIGLGCHSLGYVLYGTLSTAVWFLLLVSSVLAYYAHNLSDDPPIPDLESGEQTNSVMHNCSDSRGAGDTTTIPLRQRPSSRVGNAPLDADEPAGTGVMPDRSDSSGARDSAAGPPDRRQFSSAGDVSVDADESAGAGVIPDRSDSLGAGDSAAGLPDRRQSSSTGDVPLDADEPAGVAKNPRPRRIRARLVAGIADALRWLGKSLAVISAVGVIAHSVSQFAGVYDNCFCGSSVFAWGSLAFDVISPSQSDVDLTRSAGIGAVALSLTCCAFFVGSIYLVRDSSPS